MSIDRNDGSSHSRAPSGYDVRSLLIGVAGILVLGAIAVAVLAWAWPDLPDRIATHWDGAGVADDFSDKSTGLAAVLIALPVGLAIAVAALMGFVPRSAPGTRWISAFPVGLAAAVLATTVGSTVQQRNGDEASIGVTMLLMLVVGIAATAAVVPLLPAATAGIATAPPPADAPRLDTSSRVWWTGTASTSPWLLAGLGVLCLAPAVVIAATSRIGWVVALFLTLPALLVATNARFRVTIGGDQVIASGAFVGWPKLAIPLESIESADVAPISMWSYGGMGLRYGPKGTGVITRSGDGLLIERADGTNIAITCDDATTAAATINTLRSRAMS